MQKWQCFCKTFKCKVSEWEQGTNIPQRGGETCEENASVLAHFFAVGRPSRNFLVLSGWDEQDDTGRTFPASSHYSLQPRKGTATVAAAGWGTGNGKINGRQRLKTHLMALIIEMGYGV